MLLVEDSIELQAMLQAMLGEIPSVEVIASVESEKDALAVMRDETELYEPVAFACVAGGRLH
ncbi:hypothetical protein [Mycobacterium tuberculosis]|uniref:hypothetical protein n=1 Tax=Mycobacterium tuberculosis TaxID=1773 RepID=UPI002729B806|nr:hypothetical protein [Mycobacterium tuberculosis]